MELHGSIFFECFSKIRSDSFRRLVVEASAIPGEVTIPFIKLMSMKHHDLTRKLER